MGMNDISTYSARRGRETARYVLTQKSKTRQEIIKSWDCSFLFFFRFKAVLLASMLTRTANDRFLMAHSLHSFHSELPSFFSYLKVLYLMLWSTAGSAPLHCTLLLSCGHWGRPLSLIERQTLRLMMWGGQWWSSSYEKLSQIYISPQRTLNFALAMEEPTYVLLNAAIQ